MMAAYARADFEDPDIYLNTCVAVLSPFPDRVIETVTDIAKGIQTESAYPPRVAELRARAERCERSLIAMETVKAKKIGADKFRNEMPRPVDRSNHPTIEELKEKHNYWLGGDRDNQPAPFDQKPAGRRANLLVPRSSPRYEQMVERSKKADPADWRWDPEGIRVPLTWWHKTENKAAPRTLAEIAVECGVTQEQLDAIPDAKTAFKSLGDVARLG